MAELLDEDELRSRIDRGVYHEQKRLARNNVWFGYAMAAVGFVTCWTLIGLYPLWKGLKIAANAREHREMVERVFEDYQHSRAGVASEPDAPM